MNRAIWVIPEIIIAVVCSWLSTKFLDKYGMKCSIQESSAGSEACIWLGIDDIEPKIMASKAHIYDIPTEETTGWIPYPIPNDVLLHSRMHLNQEHAKELITLLQYFVETGELPQ
jgi:hypothetical protein